MATIVTIPRTKEVPIGTLYEDIVIRKLTDGYVEFYHVEDPQEIVVLPLHQVRVIRW